MLQEAEKKGVYQHLVTADLGLPLDSFPMNHFDAAILVGVFSFGQAPAHALDEIVRVVKPGGVVVFTMRTDFFETDAMGVRSRIGDLEENSAWQLAELTEPEPYLPKKDPSAMFRVWCYRVLDTKVPDPPDNLAEAVRVAMSAPSPVKRIDHCHIWNSMASRLYERYIECPDYYLPNCEEEILSTHADEIAGSERFIVELGCGSARKVQHVFRAALSNGAETGVDYMPIDLSKGALASTKSEIDELFQGRVRVDPRHGHFREILPLIPEEVSKAVFFFGGSIGNIETLPATVKFLESLRAQMTKKDRFVVGIDLDKDESVLIKAYEAGPPNRSFFLNMLRRINNELGANFDLTAFQQESTYDRSVPYQGIQDRCVNLKLVTTEPQEVFVSHLDLEVHLDPGDAVQVGTSRKFRQQDIERLFSLAGLRLRRQWLDRKRYYSLNEVVRDDAALGKKHRG
jgi:L-histidine N-alpha-methyltransferase